MCRRITTAVQEAIPLARELNEQLTFSFWPGGKVKLDFNGGTLTSDAGHLMAQNEPFAVCYWDTPDGRVFSLRSTDDGLDVQKIAVSYGGGGHRNAAGFRMPIGWEGDS